MAAIGSPVPAAVRPNPAGVTLAARIATLKADRNRVKQDLFEVTKMLLPIVVAQICHVALNGYGGNFTPTKAWKSWVCGQSSIPRFLARYIGLGSKYRFIDMGERAWQQRVARFTHVKDKAKLYDLVNSITALLPSDRTWPRQEERYVAFLNAFPEFERIYL